MLFDRFDFHKELYLEMRLTEWLSMMSSSVLCLYNNNAVCRHFLPFSQFASTLHLQPCIIKLPQAAAITARTKWDFQHILNYHGTALAIRLIQLKFLQSNSIQVDGCAGVEGYHHGQNMRRNFLWNNRQYKPHQESKQFQNFLFMSRCPPRAQSVSLEMERQKVWMTLIFDSCLIRHTLKAKQDVLSWLDYFRYLIELSLKEILRLVNSASERISSESAGEMRWEMGHEKWKARR